MGGSGAALKGHADDIRAVAADATGGVPIAVSGGSDGTMRLWSLATPYPTGR
ncbi:hypothetical protein ACFXJ8_15825 [Nonomuraea sp. NPDC059194]|uniref:hypothetical protein n=1 Tax=Nonomuraea sp. NPDC059194 TaxID=3346764 RepID=UPI0036A91FED